MPQQAGTHSRSKIAGRYQGPKPTLMFVRRVRMDPDDETTLWWDEQGRLFVDRELTVPTRLTIVEIADAR
jgi:hypothetical protein